MLLRAWRLGFQSKPPKSKWPEAALSFGALDAAEVRIKTANGEWEFVVFPIPCGA